MPVTLTSTHEKHRQEITVTNRNILESLLERIEHVDFDSIYAINSNGRFVSDPDTTLFNSIFAPDVEHSDEHDILINDRPWKDSTEWEPMRALTGQYGYNGCTMHASEQYSIGVVGEMLDRLDPGEFGIFCHTSVEVRECDDTCDEDCLGDHFPAGWTILQYTDKSADDITTELTHLKENSHGS